MEVADSLANEHLATMNLIKTSVLFYCKRQSPKLIVSKVENWRIIN